MNSEAHPKKLNARRIVSVVVTPIALFLYCQVGADILSPKIGRLNYLKIGYPAPLNYVYFVIPAMCAVVWFVLRRRMPIIAFVMAVLLCILLFNIAGAYVDSRTDKIPVRRFVNEAELTTLETKLQFPIAQQHSSGRGTELLVAHGTDQREQLLAELKNYFGVLPDTQPSR
jgi:hypothetical protein